MPDRPAPSALPVAVVEDGKAPPGDLIGALAALLLARARDKCQNAGRRVAHADDKADMAEAK